MRARIGVVVLASAIPLSALVVDPRGWYPFGPGKWLVVSTLIPLGAALVLWDRPARSAGRVSLLAWLLVGWMMMAAALGVDRTYGWIGTPERHFGVLTWVLAALALVTGQALDPNRDGGPLRWGVILAGLGVGLTSTAEALGWELEVFRVTAGRLTATAGSAAYLGAWTALLVPAALGIAGDRRLGRRVRVAAGVSAITLAVACVGSGARAAWFGLAVAGVAVVIVQRRWLVAHRRLAVGGFALGAVALVAVLALSPAGGRVASASDPEAAGGRSRLDEWRVASRVIAAHPLTGVGPEGYRIAFAEGVDDAYQRAYGRDPLPDRAHSGPLDLAVTGGLPALALWLTVVALVVRAALRAVRTGPWWMAGLGVGLIAHFAGQLLLFPIAELEPVVWLLAGVVIVATTPALQRRDRVLARPVVAGVGLVAGLALVAGGLDVAADRLAARSVAASRGGDHAAAVRFAGDAAELRPDELRLHLLAAQTVIADDQGTNAALAAVSAALDVSPQDPIVLRQHARYLAQRASGTHLPDDVAAARVAAESLVGDDPANAAGWMLVGAAARLAADAPGAVAAFARAEALSPRDPQPSIELALLYLDTGAVAAAVEASQRAVARAPDDPRAQQVLERSRSAAAPSGG